MGYKDKDAQRQYQTMWRSKRRDDWIAANGPCAECKSDQGLKAVHKVGVDHTRKVSSMWGLNELRRAQALSKCEVLCARCAKRRICKRLRHIGLRQPHRAQKLCHDQVKQIIERLLAGKKEREIAAEFKLNRTTVNAIKHGTIWRKSLEKIADELAL